jgi:site-specific recombinase XerC
MARFVPEPEQCIALASIDGSADAMAFNAAFGVLYGTGILLCELRDLRPIDVSGEERTRVAIGGSRARILPLPKGAADRLRLLLGATAGRPGDAPIFGAPPVSIGDRRISKELKRRSHILGFCRPLDLHDLRIAFARHMADRQTPIEIIAEMMGYRNMNSVRRLLKMSAS